MASFPALFGACDLAGDSTSLTGAPHSERRYDHGGHEQNRTARLVVSVS